MATCLCCTSPNTEQWKLDLISFDADHVRCRQGGVTGTTYAHTFTPMELFVQLSVCLADKDFSENTEAQIRWKIQYLFYHSVALRDGDLDPDWKQEGLNTDEDPIGADEQAEDDELEGQYNMYGY